MGKKTGAPGPGRRRSADRHKKPRKQVLLSVEHHAALESLASTNRRPMRWELEIAVEKHLEAAGVALAPAADSGGTLE